ncbi:MAG TPA: 4-hydroxyphenylacetate 3-hydroxylase N-terminal domain-containing protein [Candidatus Binataceae bacterium]|nr:4-hydroxyphenylacetate 3-hydroxylase N-terminal domain-containing protein [Candidatus Binataceae bacterium]
MKDDKSAAAGVKTGQGANAVRPFTGREFLESLRDSREVWIYGERVKDVTAHPAFRNSARMLARMYDALHDPKSSARLTAPTDTGNGGFTHRYFKIPHSGEELVADRDAIAEWAKISYGWMGRSPDYKASLTGTLGANAEFYAPYQENALRWYRRVQERCLFLNHAIINPPVDKSKSPDEVLDVFVHAEKETDAGVIVSGAKVVATGSALTNCNFIGFYGPTPLGKPEAALFAILPMDSAGVKLICRPSYELMAATMGSPFDYPLSSRFDENDAILVLDKVLIPWENLFVYRDLEKANSFFPASGFTPRFTLHGCTRLAVKLDFLAGVLLKAIDAIGAQDLRSAQVQIGEVIAWRSIFWGLSDAMVKSPEAWVNGAVQPNTEYGMAYRFLATTAYPRIKEIAEQTISSGLIYLNSHSVDFKTPELRPYIDKYIRGSNGYDALERVKLLKVLWDSVGTEFGGRHELYERNYAGNYENIRLENLPMAIANGLAGELKASVDRFMSEYDLDGWRVLDLINPTDVNRISGGFTGKK